VVLAAVATNGGALHYASARIQGIPTRNAASRASRRTTLCLLNRKIPQMAEMFRAILEAAALWEEPVGPVA